MSQLGKGHWRELKLGRDRKRNADEEAGFEEANLWGRRLQLWNLECQAMGTSGHCLEGGTGDPGDAFARGREVRALFNASDSDLYELTVQKSIGLAGKTKSLSLRQTPDESVLDTFSCGALASVLAACVTQCG